MKMIKVIQKFGYFCALLLIDFCHVKSSVKDLRISKQNRKSLQVDVFVVDTYIHLKLRKKELTYLMTKRRVIKKSKENLEKRKKRRSQRNRKVTLKMRV